MDAPLSGGILSCEDNTDSDLDRKSLGITVLCGGPSQEHQVSLQSGHAVAEALRTAGYDPVVADISGTDLSALDRPGLDVVFIALHGEFGEDGQLQKILEQRSIPFCGSGSAASKLAFNKFNTKQTFTEHAIPTPEFDILDNIRNLPQILQRWSTPLVAKPVSQGSSIGVRIIRNRQELEPTAKELLTDFGEVLIEQYIDGAELTVGIVDQTPLPILEIRTCREFYDYQAKYQDDSTEFLFEIDIDKQTYETIQQLALSAAHCLSMRDFCRVDFCLDQDKRPFVLEVNTIPGFTNHSLLPKAAAKAGMDMPRLCDRIVWLTLTRAGKLK